MPKIKQPKLVDAQADMLVLAETSGNVKLTLAPVYEVFTTTGQYLGNMSCRTLDHMPSYTAQPLANPCFRREFTSPELALAWMIQRAGLNPVCELSKLEISKKD